MKFLTILAITASLAFLPACQNGQLTPQASAVINAAKPIAEAAIVAAAASKGVPPSDSTAILTAIDSLWGAYEKAQAQQPIAQGASAPAIGQAIVQAISEKAPNTPQSQVPALLQAAAQSITPK